MKYCLLFWIFKCSMNPFQHKAPALGDWGSVRVVSVSVSVGGGVGVGGVWGALIGVRLSTL